MTGAWYLQTSTAAQDVQYVEICLDANCSTTEGLRDPNVEPSQPGRISMNTYWWPYLPDGPHKFWVRGVDSFDARGPIGGPLNVVYDSCTPTMRLYAPADGDVLSGVQTLNARFGNCNFNRAIFYVDDIPLPAVKTPAEDGSYQYTLDTRTLANGTHTVRVAADDGNITVDDPVWVTVENTLTPISGYYLGLGADVRNILGPPLGNEYRVGGGQAQNYAGGRIYWSQTSGAHVVYGAILSRYLAVGGPTGPLGFPTTDESRTPDNVGRYNHFSRGGSIYWTPSTGAHAIYGSIRATWAATGWERGPLGYPTTDEMGTPDRIGRYNHFSRGGSVYWTPSTGAHAIYGSIRATWAATGWERGPLGYPTTDEMGTPDRIGRYNHFSRGGSVYWTPTTGARAIYGAIRTTWGNLGWERSRLGYPISSEYAVYGGRRNDFQRGAITYNAATRTTRVVYR